MRRGLKRQRLFDKGVTINAGCDEQCAVTVTVAIPASLARKLRIAPIVGTLRKTIGSPAKPLRLTTRLSSKARAKLARIASFALTVVVTAKDQSGNISTVKKTVTVRR
jgi:hypothetical protein